MTGHLVESTLFAIAAGLAALALRGNRARVRHGLWLAASVKFLVPFALLVAMGNQVRWRTAPAMAELRSPVVVEAAAARFTAAPPARAIAQPAPLNWMAILWTVWAAVSMTLCFIWWMRWRKLAAAVRVAKSLDLGIGIAVRTSPAFAEPGVFGVWRPVLLLPEGIGGRLTPTQLDAVIQHELRHVRRQDNLTTAIHMAVEALFWFHPLVWWIGSRLIEERERACDEEVLLKGCEPEAYAEGILRICELYLESPLRCVAGVGGANLPDRIEAIMSHRIGVRLNSARKAALVAVSAAALGAPLAVGILNAPYLDAQSTVPAKFEVASVKPCDAAESGPGRKSGGSGGLHWTPDRLAVRCAALDDLIRDAYLSYPEGKRWAAATSLEPTPEAFGVEYGGGCFTCGRGVSPVSNKVFHQPIQGSPAWAHTERYDIDAKAEGPATPEMMRGPMMQALLADRFKLKIRRESQEVPVYDLTVAKGGLKIPPARAGSCFTGPPTPGRGGQDAQPRICGRGGVQTKGGNDYFSPGTTIAKLCSNLSGWFDRDVVDKTGITGVFDIQLDAHRVDLPDLNPTPPADGMPPRPLEWDRAATFRIFQAALAKIGLKLEPAKESGAVLVIDHVERPSGN